MGRQAVASKRLPSQAVTTRSCPDAGSEAQLAESRLEAIEWRAYALAANSRRGQGWIGAAAEAVREAVSGAAARASGLRVCCPCDDLGKLS